jgi:hypothetical protein
MAHPVEGPFANAPVGNPSASQRVCSAEWPLSREPFKESIFSWSHFQRPLCSLAFFYTLGLAHTLLQSNNDSTTSTLRSRLIVNGRISRQTVNRRLKSAMFRARRPIKRPLLTIRHKNARFQWARDHMGWNIRSW